MSKYAVLIGDLIIARNKAHTIVYSYHQTLKSESFRDVTIWRMWNLMGRPKPRVIIETRINEEIERRSESIYQHYLNELKVTLKKQEKSDSKSVNMVLNNFNTWNWRRKIRFS